MIYVGWQRAAYNYMEIFRDGHACASSRYQAIFPPPTRPGNEARWPVVWLHTAVHIQYNTIQMTTQGNLECNSLAWKSLQSTILTSLLRLIICPSLMLSTIPTASLPSAGDSWTMRTTHSHTTVPSSGTCCEWSRSSRVAYLHRHFDANELYMRNAELEIKVIISAAVGMSTKKVHVMYSRAREQQSSDCYFWNSTRMPS